MSEWFIEQESNELSFGYHVRNTLFKKKSPYQEVKVLDTMAYGKMLVIDNFVMLTEMDEFIYHEMISHIPLCYHKNPQHVLVIGGGDGGTVREIVKHEEVVKVTLCEIDQLVVDVSKKFFPSVSSELTHEKVEVIIGDGIEYIRKHKGSFDVIIIDSTDPIGPGEGLFTSAFYSSVSEALKPNGIVTLQSESPWYSSSLLNRIQSNVSKSFTVTKPFIAPIPTYPRGLWSWTMASNSRDNFLSPDLDRFENIANSLRYLTKNQLINIFDIPPFFRDKIGNS